MAQAPRASILGNKGETAWAFIIQLQMSQCLIWCTLLTKMVPSPPNSRERTYTTSLWESVKELVAMFLNHHTFYKEKIRQFSHSSNSLWLLWQSSFYLPDFCHWRQLTWCRSRTNLNFKKKFSGKLYFLSMYKRGSHCPQHDFVFTCLFILLSLPGHLTSCFCLLQGRRR